MRIHKTLGSSININGCTPDEVIAKMITIEEKYKGWDMTIYVEYDGYEIDVEGTKLETQEEETLRLENQAITDEIYKQNKINKLKKQLAELEEPLEVKFEGFDHE